MIVVGIIGAIAVVLLFLNAWTAYKQRDHLRASRTSLSYTPVQIICGDCSGEGVSPLKTLLDRRGHCECCGGRSYFLASQRGAYFDAIRLLKIQDPFMMAASGLMKQQYEDNVVQFNTARSEAKAVRKAS